MASETMPPEDIGQNSCQKGGNQSDGALKAWHR
jgi:hypothetical protein